MDSDDDILKDVDKFIQRLNDGIFIVSPKATDLWYDVEGQDISNLSDILSKVINEYRLNEDSQKKPHLARNCIIWIQKALTTGVIHEGEGLAKKLDECREEKNQMKKELNSLSMNYLTLQGEYETFKKRVGLKNKADWEKKEK